MAKLRILLCKNGVTEHDFIMEMDKPLLGEIISHKDEHYDIRFIQYVMNPFLDGAKLDYILVTAIRKIIENKKQQNG